MSGRDPGDEPDLPPPVPVRDVVDRVLRGLGAPGVDAVEVVFHRWDEVVGGVLAARTRPVALERGVLVLAADDPAVVTHVRYLEAQLVERLAELLGPERVTSVEVRVDRRGRGRGRPGPAGG